MQVILPLGYFQNLMETCQYFLNLAKKLSCSLEGMFQFCKAIFLSIFLVIFLLILAFA